MPMFRCSTVTGESDSEAHPARAREIVTSMQGRPAWDTMCIAPNALGQFPFMNLSWHEGHGFEVQCFEAPESVSDFLVSHSDISSPEVYVELGGQTQELWPLQLFVPLETAVLALHHFLETGRENPNLVWVRIDRFPRRTVRPPPLLE